MKMYEEDVDYEKEQCGKETVEKYFVKSISKIASSIFRICSISRKF